MSEDDKARIERIKGQVKAFRDDYTKLREELGRVIVGHAGVLDDVLACVFAGGHALLEGVPGLGKTLLVRTLSEALELPFNRIQFTPDLMPADIIGTHIVVEDPSTGRRSFEFQPGPVFCQILLADEINRATPKTQSALLETMQEKSVTIAGEHRSLDRPFFVLATQNPLEMEGTYPLPEAQLDRFMFKVVVEYSSREELSEILDRTTRREELHAEKVMTGERLLEHQELVREVVAAPHVKDYAVRLTLATHPEGEFAAPVTNQFVRYGSSPRGAQAILLTSKVRALLDGRYNVSFDDVEAVAAPALRHRLILNFEGEAEGISTDHVIAEILKAVPHDAEPVSALQS